jgi:hypothetical protein
VVDEPESNGVGEGGVGVGGSGPEGGGSTGGAGGGIGEEPIVPDVPMVPEVIAPLELETGLEQIIEGEELFEETIGFGGDGRKLDFLFGKDIKYDPLDNQLVKNASRAAGNSSRIGIADTPGNRRYVIGFFNRALNNPNSIVGPGRVPGSNEREFFLPGATGTGSKITFVELNGVVITIMAK